MQIHLGCMTAAGSQSLGAALQASPKRDAVLGERETSCLDLRLLASLAADQ